MSRKLRPDEIELWQKITAQTQPLTRKRPLENMASVMPEVPTKKRDSFIHENHLDRLPKRLTPNQKTQALNKVHLSNSIEDHLHAAPVQMDKKSFTKMKRGKLKPEGRIDLHGLTLDRAHPALTRFILSSQASGKRLVLVITGKGKHKEDAGPIPTRIGVLRHQVPQWLSLPPLSQAILQVTQSHKSHGGAGAYYVYLRKSR